MAPRAPGRGEVLEAVRACARVLAGHPGDCGAFDRLELLATRAAADPLASFELEAEAAARPDDPAVRFYLACAWAGQRRYRAADEAFAAVAARTGDPPCVVERRIGLAELEGRTEDALALARSVTARAAGRGRAWLARGRAAWGLSRLAEARESFERAIEISPSPEAAGNLAAVLHRLGDRAGAIRVIEDGLARFPDQAALAYNLGVMEAEAGRTAEAEAAYRRALALDPKQSQVRNNLALLLAQGGRTAEAETMLNSLLADEPAFAEAWINFGTLLARQGREEEAEAAYRRAVDLEPGRAEAWYNLAAVSLRRGRRERAAEFARAALARDPDHARAAVILKEASAASPGPAR